MLCPQCILSRMYFHAAHVNTFLISTPGVAVTSPMRYTADGPPFSASTTFVDLCRADDEDHADPIVERARHLERRDVPVLHQEAEHRRQLPRRGVDIAPERLGQHARDVLREPAARDVRHALEQPALCDGEHLRDVYLRRREQRAPERHVGLPGHGALYGMPATARILRTSEKPFECRPDDATPRSTSPGTMSARGRIRCRSTAPTAKACEVVVACDWVRLAGCGRGGLRGCVRACVPTFLIHARHFCGLTADERAAGLLAALCNALNHLRRDGDVELACSRSSQGSTAVPRPARVGRSPTSRRGRCLLSGAILLSVARYIGGK